MPKKVILGKKPQKGIYVENGSKSENLVLILKKWPSLAYIHPRAKALPSLMIFSRCLVASSRSSCSCSFSVYLHFHLNKFYLDPCFQPQAK